MLRRAGLGSRVVRLPVPRLRSSPFQLFGLQLSKLPTAEPADPIARF
jgi:hypothetical protein